MPKMEKSTITLKFDFDFRIGDFDNSKEIVDFYNKIIYEYLDNIADDLGVHNIDVTVESGYFNKIGEFDFS